MCVSVTSPDDVPATGTGTLVIQLQDVNDNAPTIEEREIKVRLFPPTLPPISNLTCFGDKTCIL